jgi:hypothetical protein
MFPLMPPKNPLFNRRTRRAYGYAPRLLLFLLAGAMPTAGVHVLRCCFLNINVRGAMDCHVQQIWIVIALLVRLYPAFIDVISLKAQAFVSNWQSSVSKQ